MMPSAGAANSHLAGWLGLNACCVPQFKWPVPEETGGFAKLTYTLELFPPPNLEAQTSQLPEVRLPCFACPSAH